MAGNAVVARKYSLFEDEPNALRALIGKDWNHSECHRDNFRLPSLASL
jgi:hypothetical protein